MTFKPYDGIRQGSTRPRAHATRHRALVDGLDDAPPLPQVPPLPLALTPQPQPASLLHRQASHRFATTGSTATPSTTPYPPALSSSSLPHRLHRHPARVRPLAHPNTRQPVLAPPATTRDPLSPAHPRWNARTIPCRRSTPAPKRVNLATATQGYRQPVRQTIPCACPPIEQRCGRRVHAKSDHPVREAVRTTGIICRYNGQKRIRYNRHKPPLAARTAKPSLARRTAFSLQPHHILASSTTEFDLQRCSANLFIINKGPRIRWFGCDHYPLHRYRPEERGTPHRHRHRKDDPGSLRSHPELRHHRICRHHQIPLPPKTVHDSPVDLQGPNL